MLHPVPGPVIADRPGFTDGPTALPARAVQLEAGVSDDRVGGVTYRSLGELLLRAGIGARTELRFFANSVGLRSASGVPTTHGLEDSKLGVKLALHTAPDSVHRLLPRLALLAATTLPTGSANRTAHRPQPEAKLAASWTTSGPLSLYSNLGFGAGYDGADWSSRAFGSLALWLAAGAKLSFFGEALLARRVSGPAVSANYLDAGLAYLLGSHVQADLRVGHGLGGAVAHERFFGAGIAWRW